MHVNKKRHKTGRGFLLVRLFTDFFLFGLYLSHAFLNQKRYNTDANSFSPASRGRTGAE
jgi:hypothetical protein